MRLVNHLIWSIVALTSMNMACAQDINFDDLKRQGNPLSKTVMITGLVEEAKRNLSRFDEIDSSRVAQREIDMSAAAQRAAQQPTQGAGVTASKPTGRSFTCEVECTNRTSQLGGEPLAGKIAVSINANDASSARVDVRNAAGEGCKRTFGGGAWYRSAPMMSGGNPYISCREAR